MVDGDWGIGLMMILAGKNTKKSRNLRTAA
jgi:hypothetical protein